MNSVCQLMVTCLKYLLMAVVLVPISFVDAMPAPKSADQIFADLQKSVFQIRMIEQKSGSQAALGTGFLIENDWIATNYHVVSSQVLEPERFRIELEIAQQTYLLTVVAVDVVNDLAILSAEALPELGIPFQLADKTPNQGTLLYSLGNPHNLGLTIVQGNYNGLVEHKFWDRIHYSGAINSGMSGGPTVNNDYEVVGINVASAGNQVGFLVPVAALRELVEKSRELSSDFEILDDMASQIANATDEMLEDLFAADWPLETMGQANILGKTVEWFDCWGNSNDDTENRRLEISRGCNNGDNIFLSHSFNTGYFEYEYHYFEAPRWPAPAFYRYLRSTTSGAVPGNSASKDDVGNYVCENGHVQTGDGEHAMKRRISYCIRPYKKLQGLYDVFYIGLSEDRDHRAVMDHYTLSGVTQSASKEFLNKFIGVMSWQ